MDEYDELEQLRAEMQGQEVPPTPAQEQPMTPAPAQEQQPIDEVAELEQLRQEMQAEQRLNDLPSGMAPAIAATSGVTFGFVDELAGMLAPYVQKARDAIFPDQQQGTFHAELSSQTPYEIARDEVRQVQDDYRTVNPVESTVAEMAGAIPTGMVAAPRTIAGMGGRGALEGALSGVGYNENPEDLAGDITTGTVLGGGLGAGMGKAADFVGEKIIPNVTNPLSNAEATIRQTLENFPDGFSATARNADNLPPEGALYNAMGKPGIAVGQASVGADPFYTRQLAEQMATNQNAGATDRIRGGLNKMLNRAETPNYYEMFDDMSNARYAAAKPYYDSSFAHTLKLDDETKQILQQPGMQKAIKQARDYLRNTEGIEIPKDRILEYKNLNEVIRGFNDVLKNEPMYRDLTTKTLTRKGKQLSALKNRLLKKMDEQVSDYARAREIWGGRSAELGAYEDGLREFRTMPVSKLEYKLNNELKSENMRKAYLDGAMEDIQERMGRASSGSLSNLNFLGGENMRKKLHMLVGDKNKVDDFLNTLDTERQMREASAKILEGSQTQLRQSAMEALKAGVIKPEVAQFLKQNTIANLWGLIERKAQEAGIKNAEELGQLLFTTRGPEAINELLRKLKAPRTTRRWAKNDLPAILNAVRLPTTEQFVRPEQE